LLLLLLLLMQAKFARITEAIAASHCRSTAATDYPSISGRVFLFISSSLLLPLL